MSTKPNCHSKLKIVNSKCHDKGKINRNPLKGAKSGKLLFWNKGGSNYLAKKDDIEILIQKHNPIAIGIAEINIAHDSHEAPLIIDNYILERDNLSKAGLTTRAAVYVRSSVQYRRREDLEPVETPLLWIEFNAETPSAWLLGIGYREWRTLNPTTKASSITLKSQLLRLESWEQSCNKAANEDKPIFFMSDCNIDVQPWHNPNAKLTDYQYQRKPLLSKLKEIAVANGLSLLKTLPLGHKVMTMIRLLTLY